MTSNIKICLAGEVSCGKTTLTSVILNQIAGEIKMKRSTMNYTCFSECCEYIDDTSQSCDNIKCIQKNIGDMAFFESSSRKYKFDIYDSVGFNDIDVEKENIDFFEKFVMPKIDIMIVMLDVTKCLSTNSELQFLQRINEYKCKKFFVINKIDDMADQEFVGNTENMIDYLVSKKYCDKTDIVSVGAKNLFDTIFQTKNYVCLELLYKSRNNILDIFGYYKLSQTILSYCDNNIGTIYNNKLYHTIENCTSLTELYNIYRACCEICGDNICGFITYIQKVKFNEHIFDSDIKNWIHKLDNACLDCIFKHYCDNFINDTINDIHEKFGCDISVLGFLLKNMNYEVNRILFFDILNIDGNMVDYKISTCINIILNKVNNILLQHIKTILQKSDRDAYITYLTLKTLSNKFNYANKFPCLNKMKLIDINNPAIHELILDDDTEFEIMEHHLYVLCSLFFQNNNNKIVIQKLLNEKFTIFPCSNNGVPLSVKWKEFNNEKSRDTYNKSNKSFAEYDIGLLCGNKSGVIAIKIYDDTSLKYWKNINNDISEHTLNFKMNGATYYIYKWNSEMINWKDVDNIINCNDNKINIDFVLDSYIIIDPTIIEECVNFYGSITGAINDMPDWLMKIIKDNYREENKKNILEDWGNIENIPDEMLDQELCNLAVSEDAHAMMYIPDIYKSMELCKKAIELWHDFDNDCENMNFMEMCETAVQEDGYVLCCVPDKLKTRELCDMAVETDAEALKYVPENLKTKEMCVLAVNKNCLALEYAPENLKTKEMCESAVTINGYALEFVPENLKTKEMCELAVAKEGYALEFVPENLKTKEMYDLAVAKGGYTLEFVPENLKTKEMCELAVAKEGYALEFVPENLKTKEMYDLAVAKGGYTLRYVPENLKTKEMCELAVAKEGYALEYVPEKLKTKEMYDLAVAKGGYALEYVPEKFKKK